MTVSEYKRLIGKVLGHGEAVGDAKALADAFELVKALEEQTRIEIYDVEGREVDLLDNIGEDAMDAHAYSKRIREACERLLAKGGGDYPSTLMEVELASMLFDAPYDFDVFCRYIESEREDDKQFYLPRRKQLYPLARALQDLEMGRLKMLGLSLPPGIGKTALAIFFMCFTSGRHPEMQSIIGSHNIEFVRGVYDEILRILSPKGEYLWHRVFPKVSVCGTNAKDLRIDLGKRKRFQTIELVSIKSGNAGKVRATNLLYCDDLVEGIEQAMNRDRMDDLWKKYTIDLKQREQGNGPCGNGVRELHISTRWSVHDVVGRLEATYGDKPDSRFINVPVENEETGKSNFDYPYGLGYSDATIAEIKEAMDPAAYKALYLGQPIEYEGQLYPEEELRRYFDLPEEEPDAIIAVCDTKTTGSDYCVLPIAYQYGSNFFIEDVVCENYAPDVVETSVVQMLLKHKVQKAQFESNVAGGKMAQVVQQRTDEAGGRTNITTKWTQANKETKIQANAGWVKKHCVFRDNTRIKGSEWAEYRLMMKQLCGYTLAGKNRHDDVPDAFAQLALYVDSNLAAKVKINKRWF